jgi:hypothetical protein
MSRLGTHCVDRHDGSLQRQQREQFWDRRNLVGLGVRRHLAQHEPLFAAPRAHHMQRRSLAGRIERMAQRLAVNSDDAFCRFGKAPHESHKARAKRLGVEAPEQPAERVVARQTAGKAEEFA